MARVALAIRAIPFIFTQDFWYTSFGRATLTKGTMMDEIQGKLKRLSANWREYQFAEDIGMDNETMNRLNREHRELCRWLAAHGMPFTTLKYDPLTLTFSGPHDTIAVASL